MPYKKLENGIHLQIHYCYIIDKITGSFQFYQSHIYLSVFRENEMKVKDLNNQIVFMNALSLSLTHTHTHTSSKFV